ncbi:MAG TPA: glycosyltransferase [Solirubrobacteraceae bacterium]|nr:glycosyltransferase [Solirubrobacteraceae bacterium]
MTARPASWRAVVTIPEPNPLSWSMPPAELHESTHVIGGLRTLHELAVALAATGREVELRGPVSRPVFDALTKAAGAHPELPGDRRRPRSGEIVVNIEGEHDPLRFARHLLSPARLVVAMLAPSGQFGWPFVSPWQPRSPLTIDPEEVGRAEHLRAIAALGIDIWTHMPPIHRLAEEVGARSSFIGSGEPNPVAEVQTTKDLPVVYLQANRWAPLAEAVARRVHAPVAAIPQGDHETVMAELARAKVMLWPCRVEGDGRLLREARARGTVVVGLSSNIYAVGLDEPCGAVAVEDLGEMPRVVEQLLSDSARLSRLAEAGRRSAREQVDWPRYVQRVDAAAAAVEARPDDDAASARAAFGDGLAELMSEREQAIERVGVLDSHLAEAAARLRELERQPVEA